MSFETPKKRLKPENFEVLNRNTQIDCLDFLGNLRAYLDAYLDANSHASPKELFEQIKSETTHAKLRNLVKEFVIDVISKREEISKTGLFIRARIDMKLPNDRIEIIHTPRLQHEHELGNICDSLLDAAKRKAIISLAFGTIFFDHVKAIKKKLTVLRYTPAGAVELTTEDGEEILFDFAKHSLLSVGSKSFVEIQQNGDMDLISQFEHIQFVINSFYDILQKFKHVVDFVRYTVEVGDAKR